MQPGRTGGLLPGNVDPAQWPVLRSILAQENCAFFASEFLRGPPEAPYHGRFFAAEHHEEWAELANKYKRLCVIAARGHGKSGCAGTLLTLSTGARVPVETLAGERASLVALDVRTLKYATAPATVDRASMPVPCVRIRTRTGRRIEVTKEHPFLTFFGWTEARHLSLKTRIALPKRIAIASTQKIPGAWLLGVLVGDGALTEGRMSISNTMPVLREAVAAEAHTLGWRAYSDNPKIVGISIGESDPRTFLQKHGLSGKSAYEKRVPAAIFTASDETIAEFLSGLVDTDCGLNLHDGGSADFCSVSRALMEDVQHLLTRLGIVSVLTQKNGVYKGERHESWRVTVRSRNILSLAALCHPRGENRAVLNEIAEHQRQKTDDDGAAVDLLPKEIYSLLTKSKHWFKKSGVGFERKYDCSRSKALRLAELEPDVGRAAKIRALAEAEVLWDQIVEIEDIGLRPVYPVHVPGPENYIANDILNHNSFFWTFAYPLWMAGKFPGREGYIFSASQPQAENILIRIMREVEQNPKLDYLRGESRAVNKRWSAKTLELANGFTIHARGYGTKVRGGHPVFICLDDILNDETAFSETVRTKEIEYFFSAVTNMIEPTGQIVIVGTPQHNNDIYGVLKKTPSYSVRTYPAIKPDGSALWPERFPREELDKILDEIKTLRFAREFMCESNSDMASLFPRALFKGDGVEQLNVKLGMGWKWWREHGVSKIYMGVDFALSTETGLDFTCIFVLGVDNAGNRWVIDIIRDRGLAFGEQKSMIVDAARKYRPALIFVESVQAQKIFGEELIRETDLPIKHYVTGSEKHTLDRGLPSLRVLLENRKFRIPRGDERSIELTDIWIEEMRAHSFSSGRIFTVAEHDDTCMSCWIADQAVRNGNFGFAFGEEDGDAAAFDEEIAATMEPDDEDEWGDFIPGAVPRRGRPQKVNANVLEPDEIDESEDNPRNPHGMPKVAGVRPSVAEQDWKPKDASPGAKDLFLVGLGRPW